MEPNVKVGAPSVPPTCSGRYSRRGTIPEQPLSEVVSLDSIIEGHHRLSGLIQPARLRRLTEIHHRVLGVVIALRKQETKRYPAKVLIRPILEHPDIWPCSNKYSRRAGISQRRWPSPPNTS